MNFVPIPPPCWYVICHRDNIVIEVPANYIKPLPEPSLSYKSYVVCPQCQSNLAICEFESTVNYRSQYLQARFKQLEQRITELEFSPPVGPSSLN